jgi:hydrogenase-4 component B
MTAIDAIIYALYTSLAGALLALLTSRSKAIAGWLTFLATGISGAFALFAAFSVIRDGAPPAFTALALPEYGTALRFHVDGLSAVFLGLIALVSVLAAFYSISYMKHYQEYGAGRYYPHFLLFVAGMYGIVTVTDLMLFFFLFWQLMTLPSYFLVRYEYRKRENVRAANRYLVMMQASCLLIMAGAFLLGKGLVSPNRYDFDFLSEHMPALMGSEAGLVGLAFLLFLVGFGIKAGMWPFGQMWLPDAHPAAPSPVSALLSGVMIKTGVYGLMRTFVWLVPENAAPLYTAAHWGMLLAALGTVTLFIGTMQALKQEQSKRLLAFHSIGQVGYILLGLGACVALLGAGRGEAAVVALAAIGFYGALFHTINHGIFKSLLFLNAGAMLYRTGTQDLNRLGGLMKFMPFTALTTLVASFSIAGVPFFNGFASKWSIYVSTILGAEHAWYLAVFAVIAILTSALTLASFIKFFGVSFLGRRSKLVAEKAGLTSRMEVDWIMKAPQFVLAALCLFLGLLPMAAYQLIQRSLSASQHGLAGELANASVFQPGVLSVSVIGGEALLAPAVMAAGLGLLFLLVHMIAKSGGAERRTAVPWLCGYALESEANRYTAHGLYGEFKRYFGWVGGKPRR